MRRYVSKGITPKIQANLDALEKLRDEDIDLSDMPEITDWSNAVRGEPKPRPKRQLTLRLDEEVVDWFKAHGGERGYQTRINAALRRFVEQEAKRATAE